MPPRLTANAASSAFSDHRGLRQKLELRRAAVLYEQGRQVLGILGYRFEQFELNLAVDRAIGLSNSIYAAVCHRQCTGVPRRQHFAVHEDDCFRALAADFLNGKSRVVLGDLAPEANTFRLHQTHRTGGSDIYIPQVGRTDRSVQVARPDRPGAHPARRPALSKDGERAAPARSFLLVERKGACSAKHTRAILIEDCQGVACPEDDPLAVAKLASDRKISCRWATGRYDNACQSRAWNKCPGRCSNSDRGHLPCKCRHETRPPFPVANSKRTVAALSPKSQ